MSPVVAAQHHATPFERAATLAVVTSSGFVTGLAFGARDGVANDLRHAVDDLGSGSPEALALNQRWHHWGLATKSLVVVNFGGGIAFGSISDPTPTQALLLAATWGAHFGLGFHFGHNLQQGQRWDYFGSIDASDQVAKTIGSEVVVITAVAVTAALTYAAYRSLARSQR